MNLTEVEFKGYCNECKAHFIFNMDIDVKRIKIPTGSVECFCGYCGEKAKLISYSISKIY